MTALRVHPLSFSQEQLWFIDKVNPGTPLYNIPQVLWLDGPLDAGVVGASLAEIVRRHDSLRTTFQTEGGRPVAVVAPGGGWEMSLIDLEPMSPDQREEEALGLARREALRPFDLTRGPLFRACLARLGPERHLLILTLHHMIADGWSMAILFEELSALYKALMTGTPLSGVLPGPAPAYGDYVAWQRDWLGSEAAAKDLEYWRSRLAGLPPLLELPTDRPRPSVQSFRGDTIERQVPAGLSDRLRSFSRSRGTSVFPVLLSACYALLHRYTGRRDLVIGTPVASRTRKDTQSLVGFLVNMAVLRASVEGSTSFGDLVQAAGLETLEAITRQDIPLEMVVEAVAPERSASYNPLFQIAFIVQEPALSSLELPGVRTTMVPMHTSTSKFDLTITVSDAPPNITLWAEYATDLFDRETVERMLGHYATVLDAALADPARAVSALPILPESERRQVTLGWNAEPSALATSSGLLPYELFEEAARRTPEAAAVSFEGTSLTYGELREWAALVSRQLAALGAGPESVVAVCIDRSPAMVAAVLGVLGAGAAYLPLDPGYPSERLGFMLETSGARLLLTQETLAGRLEELGAPSVRLLLLDRDGVGVPASACPSLGLPRPDPSNLAYVIFTSGSTGVPKGVMIEQHSLTNLAEAIQRTFGLKPGDRILQFSSLSFDVSVFEMVATWRAGATLCLGRRESLMPGPELAGLLRQEAVTTMFVPPTALAALPAGDYPELTSVIAAGEACPPDVVDRWAPGRRFWNLYGPTEITVWATVAECFAGCGRPPIGPPVPGATAYLLDGAGEPVPIGVPGELHVGGAGVARGYFARPDLTAERFLPDPFGETPGARLYRTGDVARWLAGGSIDYLGRADQQIKLRGFRIELGEIEAVLSSHPAVREAAVILREDSPGDKRLVAYVSTSLEAKAEEVGDGGLEVVLRDLLRGKLPEYMVPSSFVVLESLPLTPNRKIDRRALPAPMGVRPAQKAEFVPPRTATEKTIAAVWRDVLRLEKVGAHDNFFDLGGNSMLLARTGLELAGPLGREVRVVDLLANPTISALAAYLDQSSAAPEAAAAVEAEPSGAVPPSAGTRAIAVVGMAGRFPGAPSVEDLWENLCRGVNSISFFTEEEVLGAGVPAALASNPHYVRAAGRLDGIDQFDAPFFGYTPREAAVMDPQQRLFLETAWAALEDSGYAPDSIKVPVGVFAGAGLSPYLGGFGGIAQSCGEAGGELGELEAVIGNDKDFLTTRVAYKLNLSGPAVTVQTACSTSLVAVHLACQSLLAGDCDMALAGGARVHLYGQRGYLYHEGGVASPDGHCRAFDAEARGSVPGDGVGVVVLKRLADALRDGDAIRAVIRGSAINNDGSAKPGFTAPSVEAQARVIASALSAAGVEASTVGYVEAHGTGTSLGDPIEVEALSRAYGAGLERGSCALASIKTNIGHLDAAAGIAGFIKAVLCVERGLIPPSLDYRKPNPAIGFEASPFRVNTELVEWNPASGPRRAGVSSFGMGGTNVHAILEEPPAAPKTAVSPAPSLPAEIFVFSARTEWSLEAARKAFASLPTDRLPVAADAAYTLATGRSAHSHRLAVVARSLEDAALALAREDAERLLRGVVEDPDRPVAYLFPGQGSQYPGMARGLYDSFTVFRREIDTCAEMLKPALGLDLREIVYPPVIGEAETARLDRTEFAQPALFMVEWALARLLIEWGLVPRAMVGHSIGEYVAATLAGVFTLEEALALVAERGRLAQGVPGGAMLAVPLSEAEAEEVLGPRLSLAAVNAPTLCAVSGPEADIAGLEARLAAKGLECRRLHTSHAFHSAMLDPVLAEFSRAVARTRPKAPALPYLSNVTGDWVRAEEAGDPTYWTRHLRETVRFGDAVRRLAGVPGIVLIEAGPGRSLATLAKRQDVRPEPAVISTLRHPSGAEEDDIFLLTALGRAWVSGVKVDWKALRQGRPCRRVPLPTYRFEPRRYWLEARSEGQEGRPSLSLEFRGGAPATAEERDAGSPPGREGLATRFVAPRNDQERIIAGIWSLLLGIPEVGVFDDFLDLGGHSLLATQITARLGQVFQIEVPLAKFFERPTVAGLAETVEALLIAKLEATS